MLALRSRVSHRPCLLLAAELRSDVCGLLQRGSALSQRYFHEILFKSYEDGADSTTVCTWSARQRDVPIVSQLKLNFGSIPVDIITRNCHPERLKLFLWMTAKPGVDVKALQKRITFTNQPQDAGTAYSVSLGLDNDSETLSSIVSARILAVLPPRYFSLDISSGGGNVRVAGTKEASYVNVNTGGGRISGDSLAAMDAQLHSGGGDVQINKITASKVVVNSGAINQPKKKSTLIGGSVNIGALSGIDVHVDTAGAPLTMGACIASDAQIHCGTCTIDELSLGDEGTAHISSAPNSSLSLLGVTGAVEVVAQGALVVEAQLNEGASKMQVACVEGSKSAVTLHAAASLPISMELDGCGPGQCELPADAVVSEMGPGKVRAQVPATENNSRDGLQSRLQRAGNGSEGCAVSVSGTEHVVLRRRSWADGMRDAFAARAASSTER